MCRGLSPSSIVYIRILTYTLLHTAYIIYTASKNLNYVSHIYHTLLHLVDFFAIHRKVNKYLAVCHTLLHSQIFGDTLHDNVVSKKDSLTPQH